jgi:hypothetical protein
MIATRILPIFVLPFAPSLSCSRAELPQREWKGIVQTICSAVGSFQKIVEITPDA